MTDDQIAALVSAAELATPGIWWLSGSSHGGKILRRGVVEQPREQSHPQTHLQIVPDADAEYIAACSPDVLLALVATLKSERREHAALVARLREAEQRLEKQDADIATVLQGFDRSVFVRNIDHDLDPAWAIKLFPYISALGRLAALSVPSPEAEK